MPNKQQQQQSDDPDSACLSRPQSSKAKQRKKTAICINFLKGLCTRSSSACKFAHDESELSHRCSQNASVEAPPKICPYFVAGRCSNQVPCLRGDHAEPTETDAEALRVFCASVRTLIETWKNQNNPEPTKSHSVSISLRKFIDQRKFVFIFRDITQTFGFRDSRDAVLFVPGVSVINDRISYKARNARPEQSRRASAAPAAAAVSQLPFDQCLRDPITTPAHLSQIPSSEHEKNGFKAYIMPAEGPIPQKGTAADQHLAQAIRCSSSGMGAAAAATPVASSSGTEEEDDDPELRQAIEASIKHLKERPSYRNVEPSALLDMENAHLETAIKLSKETYKKDVSWRSKFVEGYVKPPDLSPTPTNNNRQVEVPSHDHTQNPASLSLDSSHCPELETIRRPPVPPHQPDTQWNYHPAGRAQPMSSYSAALAVAGQDWGAAGWGDTENSGFTAAWEATHEGQGSWGGDRQWQSDAWQYQDNWHSSAPLSTYHREETSQPSPVFIVPPIARYRSSNYTHSELPLASRYWENTHTSHNPPPSGRGAFHAPGPWLAPNAKRRGSGENVPPVAGRSSAGDQAEIDDGFCMEF